MKRTILLGTCSLAALALGTNAGASDTNQTVELDALVAEALEKNPELNFYRAEIAAAKGERVTAGVLPNPEVNGEIGRKRAHEKSGGLAGEGTAWAVSVSQPFEFPGRIGLRKAIANRQVELAEIGYEQFRAALAARVHALGYRVFAGQTIAEAAQEVGARGKELVEVLVQREPAGVTPLLETRIIEGTVIVLNRQAIEATKNAQVALLELNQLRGQPVATPVQIAKTTLKFPPLPAAEELLAGARTNNFELRTRHVELAQQGFRVELSKNERWPAVTLSPFYSEEKAGETEKTVGVGVSVPLPLWNRNGGNVQTAKARLQQAETSLLLSQRQVERDVRERALAYEVQLKEISRWRPDAVQQLREAAELGDRHYRLGSLPVSTYVELQEKYLEALEAILETQAEALEAWQQLELLTGLPMKGEPEK